ncbi:uncharacterized protein [Ptychodera flava]|uniref:uncharacterized protein n=1 Tax=Ptychodera flava TaxID=63121 RepID=UPI00396A537A
MGNISEQIVTDRFAHTNESPTIQCDSKDEYCGGTFKGIERKLDYITNLGVNAILISPFVLNTNSTDGDGYHGYWPQDIYTIDPNFGTEQDLIDLVSACHVHKIWVMADLVIHHMGYLDGCPESSKCDDPDEEAFSKFTPFNKSEHYDEVDKWSRNLPKLNHTNRFVRTTLVSWTQTLVPQYGFDGIRFSDIDDIPKDLLSELNNATGVFTIGQASTGISEAVLASYQSVLDSVFDDDMYSALDAFFNQSAHSNGYHLLPDKLSLRWGLYEDSSVLGGYIDNGTVGRFLGNNHDFTKLRNALAYLLMADWIPFIYYGTEQGPEFTGDTTNHESLWPYYVEERYLYKFISTILKHRRNLFDAEVSKNQDAEQVECTCDIDFYSFARKMTFVAIYAGGYSASTQGYLIRNHPFEKGTVLTNIFDQTDRVTVQKNGTFYVIIDKGEPKIYSRGFKLSQTIFLVLAMSLTICQLFNGF